MGIAAAEVVVGLGLVVAMTRREMVLDTDELRTLNG
jgi:NADH:ubiquinone oxidoreductase subunit K